MVETLIENEKYLEALQQLEGEGGERASYQRLTCYIALKRYQDAYEEGKRAMELASTLYYDILALYLTAAVELEYDEEAIDLLQEELTMPYIPYQYETMFQETYDRLLKKRSQSDKSLNLYDQLKEEELIALFLEPSTASDILLQVMAQFQRRNVRLFLSSIREYLLRKEAPRFAKTILLEILADQGVDDELDLSTAEGTFTVIPTLLSEFDDGKISEKVLTTIASFQTDENPMLLEYCEQLIMGYLASQYPLEIAIEEVPLLAAAAYYVSLTLLNIEVEMEEVAKQFGVSHHFLTAYSELFLTLTSGM